MKKFLAFSAAVALCLSLAACGTTSQSNESSTAATTPAETDSVAVKDTDKIQVTSTGTPTESDRTQLIVGFDAEFPPYGYMTEDGSGQYVGFDLDLAQAVCDYYGWELVRQPIDWDSKDFELESGSIDCIWNGFTMNGREDAYTWTEAYVDNSQVIVVKADSGITSYDDLAGKIVDVQADSSALAALEEDRADLAATFGTLQQVSNYNTAFLDLESGAVDAVAMDVGVASYEIGQRGDAYVILDEILTTEQYGVGFKLGNEELRDEVQSALEVFAQDGTLDAVIEKWNALQSDVDFSECVCLGQ